MAHQICHDDLTEGANFWSDKVFAPKTPVLQVERNVLNSPKYWKPVIEVSHVLHAQTPTVLRRRRGRRWPRMSRAQLPRQTGEQYGNTLSDAAPEIFNFLCAVCAGGIQAPRATLDGVGAAGNPLPAPGRSSTRAGASTRPRANV